MKKIRFIVIISFFLIIITFFLYKMQSTAVMPETTLLKAFNSSGASFASSEMSFRVKIERSNFKTVNDLKELTFNISKKLGLSIDKMQIKNIDEDNTEGLELNGISGESNIAIRAVNSKFSEDKDDSYININIINNASKTEMELDRQIIMDSLKCYGINFKVTSCITGSYKGKLSNKQLNKICAGIFKSAEARKVEGIRENNLISVSAYSPIINDSLYVNGNRINLNFAVRYNSYEDKTYIWLATPVITTEY